MVLATYVTIAAIAATFGYLFGIVSAAIALVRRRRALDDREAAIEGRAFERLRPATARLAAIGSSIIKPRPDSSRGPEVDESPADPVPVYRFRSAEALAAGYASVTRVLSTYRASRSMTAEYDALARESRRERDHSGDVPAGTLIVRLRAEQLAGNDERRRILQDAVAATVAARTLEASAP